MLNRSVIAVATVFALGSTAAVAKFPDSWTDLDPRVRATEQATATQAARADQTTQQATPSKFERLDRSSPL